MEQRYATIQNGSCITIAYGDILREQAQAYVDAGIAAAIAKQDKGEQLTEAELELLSKKQQIDADVWSKYKHFAEDELPEIEATQSIEPVITETSNEIRRSWKVIDFNEQYVSGRIKELKQQLADTDYVVIKAYEAVIMGEVAGDTVKAQIEERRKLREQINELEAQLEAHN